MNCPGHMLLFGSQLRSYRDLPFRYAESSTLHRDELAGALHGLLRVRHITQDDAHIFCSPDQIEEEIFGCLDYASYLYGLFELEAWFELSTRPEQKVGTEEEWDFTEAALRSALDRRGIAYTVNETVGKRIRNAELDKLPFTVVYGDKESDASLAVRARGGGQSTQSLAEFLELLARLSLWQAGAEPSLTS